MFKHKPTHLFSNKWQINISLWCIGLCLPLMLVAQVSSTDIFIRQKSPANIYFDTWIDLNKNGKKDVYEDTAKPINDAVAKAQQADLIIAVVGDDERTVGEARSRTSLDLPGNQRELLQALHASGKPLVMVLIHGRPMSINWANKYVPAIISAWFPGEFGGTAIAEVLFGKYNPGGKLPVTFPKTVGQIPLNFPYRKSSQMPQKNNPDPNGSGKTRVAGALYPFGYGLSYTEFTYSNLSITPMNPRINSNVEVSFDLANAGNYLGDEVVQLCIEDMVSSVVTFEKSLRGFERITLKPGQTERITMTLSPTDFALLNASMQEVVEPGQFEISIGSSSEDIRLKQMIRLNEL